MRKDAFGNIGGVVSLTMDYVVEGTAELYQHRREICGLRCEHHPPVLPHFTATFVPIGV